MTSGGAQPPPIRAVLFDLDQTLLNRLAGFERFCRELYHTSGVMAPSHSEDEAIALMLSWDDYGMRSRQDFFGDVMRQWPGVFDSLDQAIAVYLESYPRMVALEPSVRALLEDLQDAGIPCAVVTNGGSAMQAAKLRESGLEGLVKGWVISEDAGVAKPDKRIFEQALAIVGADPSEVVFVGDSPEADILGAKGLGMRTAWIHMDRQWPYDDLRPDYVLDDAAQIRTVVLD